MVRPDSSSSSAWEKGRSCASVSLANTVYPMLAASKPSCAEQGLRLARQGQQITVVSSRTSRYEPSDSVVDGIRVRRVPAFNLLERRFGVPYPIFSPSRADILSQEIAGSRHLSDSQRRFHVIVHRRDSLPPKKTCPMWCIRNTLRYPYANPPAALYATLQRSTHVTFRNAAHGQKSCAFAGMYKIMWSQLAGRSTSLL